jgi:small subunit ribosomal protein S1
MNNNPTPFFSTDTEEQKVMGELLVNSPAYLVPKPGDLVDGIVISVFKNRVLIDINGCATGMITGKETVDSANTVKSLKEGDKISAYVVEDENDEGFVVLSLRRASQEKTWQNFLEAYENGDIIDVVAHEANKGGLLLDIDGIKGFIPVSQLAPLHYPRVNGADASKILTRLHSLIGEKFKVRIINIDKENGKLILSEKAAFEESRRKAIQKLKVGQKVKGKISGVVKFGIFVTFDGLEGLVHISEIAWGHVSNPEDYGKVGDEIEILVIGIDDDKISLSMKRLTADPWIEAAKKFKIGNIVDGEVNRISEFGVFVKLSGEINGLIHISEISDEPVKDINKSLKVSDKVKAKIIDVDFDEHRIGLSIKALTEKKVEKKEKSEDTTKELKEEENPKTEDEPKKAKKTIKKKTAKKAEKEEA